jgi:hypothetical protein
VRTTEDYLREAESNGAGARKGSTPEDFLS